MDRYETGQIPAIPLSMVLMVSSPFILLAWLLISAISSDVQRFQSVDRTLAVFQHGEQLLGSLEDLRDVAPLHIFIGDDTIDAEFQRARARVDEELPAFTGALESLGIDSLTSYAEQLTESWRQISLRTPSSNTLGPFDSVDAFINRVYGALSATLYVTDLGIGEKVQVSEALLLYQDTVRNVRQSAGVLRALSRYSAERSGYLGSQDAARLDDAWWRLEQDIDALTAQLALQTERRPVFFPSQAVNMEPVKTWLGYVEDELVMADVISLTGEQAERSGAVAMAHVRAAAGGLLAGSTALADEARVSRLTRDSLLALGLLLLYILVAGFGLLFYRSRYGFLQAQAENQAKSQFLARMSHEIRTPLNGVIGLAELLAGTPMEDKQRNYVRLIESAGRTLLGLVNDILDYSRIEAGKLQLEQAAFGLPGFIAETAQIFSLPAQDNNNVLVYHLEPGVPLEVLGDCARLRQVLINLVGNAIKFTENGRVMMVVRCLESGSGSARLRFEVADSGIGLSESEQASLFRLFSQASPDVARRYGGSGLGLSISRELVRLMGGDISVSSAPGMGARFWFDLDFPVQGSALTPPLAPLAHRVYLLDEADQLSWVFNILGFRAPQVRRYASVAALVEAWREHPDGSEGMVLMHVCTMERVHYDALLEIRAALPDARVSLLTGVRNPPDPALCAQVSLIKSQAASVLSTAELLALAGARAPVDTVAQTPARGETGPLADLSGLQVLVAEDNPVNQMVTAGYLRRLGIEPDLVDNGRDAVQRYREAGGHYDVILMDLDMPILGGTEAARQVRHLEREAGWPGCRILAVSAHVLPEYGRAVTDAGMDGQLVKPVGLNDLASALSTPAP